MNGPADPHVKGKDELASFPWRHQHIFGQDKVRRGERRTLIVLVLTMITMVVEIGAGLACHSMALLADGLHMASHSMALGISALAYVYARRWARDSGFSFGSGKVNSLAGYTGAVLLGLFALLMAWESLWRFLHPVDIIFDQALLVALVGLAVNAASAGILGHGHDEEDEGHESDACAGVAESHGSDHNLRSAYLHVLADALTSVLAILALLGGKYLGLSWMDPAMGVVGAVLVARWSVGLLRLSSRVLLDRQAPTWIVEAVRAAIEGQSGAKVSDLHVSSIGPGIRAAAITVVAQKPGSPEADSSEPSFPEPRSPEYYKTLIPRSLGLVHVTIEVHRAADLPSGSGSGGLAAIGT